MTEYRTSSPQGLWLPLVTPFRDGLLDEVSLRRLVAHYAAEPIDGLVLAGTTGEEATLDAEETERLVAVTRVELKRLGSPLPLYLGLAGSDTRKLVQTVRRREAWPVDGYLITTPYYTRPSQQGMVHHFTAVAESTDRPILLYNIPYRTGVNLGNDAMLVLARLPNIVGVKDCCGDAAQSADLLLRRPEGFSVLTGEDPLYYATQAQGGDGAISATAHVHTSMFAAVRRKLVAGDRAGAQAAWRAVADLPRLLFAEPSPGPVKHWLWRAGLIDSPELRLPMTGIGPELAARLDRAMGKAEPLAAA
jgi:4-hydroxy-tetrahydrodipicolinate synthase